MSDSDSGIEEEPTEIFDLSNPDVVTKYRVAAEIAQNALNHVIAMMKDGARVIDCCQAGDDFIQAATSTIYKKKKDMQKGIGFPTCISVNHVVNHYSPIEKEGDMTLKNGDWAKLDLGCHVDGYCAVVAYTICVGQNEETKFEGESANLMMAAHTMAEGAIRLIKAGETNTRVSDFFGEVAECYDVRNVMGILSHEMTRFVIDSEKVILNRSEGENKVEECEFKPNEVYAVDIVVSSGEGKPKESTLRTTVYKSIPDSHYSLKMKASREVLSQIKKQSPTFPFTTRSLDPKKVNFGIVECANHDLVQPYPVVEEKEGTKIFHLKFTVLLMPSGTSKICGLPIDISKLSPTKEPNDKIKEVLALRAGKKKKKKKNKKKK